MSGEGILPGMRADAPDPRAEERGDVVAYLRRKARKAATIAGNDAASEDDRTMACILRRQFEILTDEFSAGLHEGEALAEATIAAATAPAPEESD